MKVVVVLPTFNERDNIIVLLDRLRVTAKKIPHHSSEYLVVDDNSPDGTSRIVEAYQRRVRNVYLIKGIKQGLGKALLRGLSYAHDQLHADVIVQMDADLSHDPSDLPKFIQAIDNGADVAIGSRYIRGGSIPVNWGFLRKTLSISANAIVRFGLGYISVHDWTGGYRAYRSKCFLQVKNEMSTYSGYLFQIAFLHKLVKINMKIVEIPIHFTDRKYGVSKIAFTKYITSILSYLLNERMKRLVVGPFKKFLVVGFFGLLINTVVLEFVVLSGHNPVLGSVIGAELAILSNFILNNAWTFRSKRFTRNSFFGKFIQFNGASIGALIIQSGTIFLGTRITGVATYRFYYLLGMCIGVIWNYIMYSRVIWK